MSELRKSSMGQVPTSESLQEMAEELIFRPSMEQRRAKSNFWARQQEMPIQMDPSTFDTPYMVRLAGNKQLKGWLSQKGFKEWFLDANDVSGRLEFLFDLAISSLESIIMNEDPKAQSARVNAIKLAAELANKMPNRWARQSYADELIGKMDEVQLEAFLEKKGVNLKLTAKAGARDESKKSETIEATILDSSVLGDKH